MNNRLFVALELSREAKEFIYNLLHGIDPQGKIRWESLGKLHITLKFLGQTNLDKTEEIKSLLEKFVVGKEPLSLELNRFGFFKRNKIPKVLWAGFSENETLKKYFSELENGFSEIGFEPENREFHPHVTLKRLKGNEDKIIVEKFLTLRFEPFAFTADTITLFKSELKPSGSIYKALNKYKLGDKNG